MFSGSVSCPSRSARSRARPLALVLLAGLLGASVADAQAEPLVPPVDWVFLVSFVGEVPLEGNVEGLGSMRHDHLPLVMLDGPGQAFVVPPDRGNAWRSDGMWTASRLALALPAPREATGRLSLADDDGRFRTLRFRIPAERFASQARTDWLDLARDACEARLDADLPGAAWWRHRANAFGSATVAGRPTAGQLRNVAGPGSIEDTFALFSGGRAVAENLQLDRLLPATPAADGEDLVACDTLRGITVAAHDWSADMAGRQPALDALATLVPEDQHALFFPGFAQLVTLLDDADSHGSAWLQSLPGWAGEAGTHQRTEQQLGLSLDDLSRRLGPLVVRSVAVTGGDPYLRLGSDMALLLQARDPDVLHPLVLSLVAAGTARMPGTETSTGALDGVEFVARVSPNREASAFVARLGDTVAVSNSEAQLLRLVATHRGTQASLAGLPEYAFFRDRYPLADPAETALLVVPDAAIRRWCGPRWRIGSSRRTRAAAELADLHAALAEDLACRTAPDGEQPVEPPPPGLGQVTRSRAGVRSATYGSLAFMTPIAELDLDLVSSEEADLYGRWRDGYQRNWSGVFDPIAVRFALDGARTEVDLTIRPLILASDYRMLVDLAGRVELPPAACDPHAGALLQMAFAIDRHAAGFGEEVGLVRALLPSLDPFGWLGPGVGLYLDDDPWWDELAAAEDAGSFSEASLGRLPLALHAEVTDPLQLAGTLVALRGMAEQSAPGMLDWDNAEHAGQRYVSVRATEAGMRDMASLFIEFALHYAAGAEGLTLSTSRAVIERALERRAAARAAPPGAGDPPAPWLGRHAGLRVEGRLLDVLSAVLDDPSEGLAQASYDNLPILEEWRRLFPGEDPVAVHERLFGQRLTCPGGGSYVWNEEWQALESTIYGHPAAPRDGPGLPAALTNLARVEAGLTWEGDGLRARVVLTAERP